MPASGTGQYTAGPPRSTRAGFAATQPGQAPWIIEPAGPGANGKSRLVTVDVPAAGGPTNLDAVAGSITITGGTATLTIAAPATAGQATIAGGTATLSVRAPATAGTISLAGGAAALAVSLAASAGTITISGGTATISVRIPATSGLVEIQGGTATLTTGGVATNLPATAGSIDVAGGTATLSVTDNVLLTATAGEIQITGGTVTLEGGAEEAQPGGIGWYGEIVPLRRLLPRQVEGEARVRERLVVSSNPTVLKLGTGRARSKGSGAGIGSVVQHGAGCASGPRVIPRESSSRRVGSCGRSASDLLLARASAAKLVALAVDVQLCCLVALETAAVRSGGTGWISERFLNHEKAAVKAGGEGSIQLTEEIRNGRPDSGSAAAGRPVPGDPSRA